MALHVKYIHNIVKLIHSGPYLERVSRFICPGPDSKPIFKGYF